VLKQQGQDHASTAVTEVLEAFPSPAAAADDGPGGRQHPRALGFGQQERAVEHGTATGIRASRQTGG